MQISGLGLAGEARIPLISRCPCETAKDSFQHDVQASCLGAEG